MNIKHFEVEYGGRLFHIEGIYPEGAYIFIREDGRWAYDYLQDDFEMCKRFAFKRFQVPYDAWIELPDDTPSLL